MEITTELLQNASKVFVNGRTVKDRNGDPQMKMDGSNIMKATVDSWNDKTQILHLTYSDLNCIKDWLKRRIPALRDGTADIWMSYALDDYASTRIRKYNEDLLKQLEDRINTLKSQKSDWLKPKLTKDMTSAKYEADLIDAKIEDLTQIINAIKTKLND